MTPRLKSPARRSLVIQDAPLIYQHFDTDEEGSSPTPPLSVTFASSVSHTSPDRSMQPLALLPPDPADPDHADMDVADRAKRAADNAAADPPPATRRLTRASARALSSAPRQDSASGSYAALSADLQDLSERVETLSVDQAFTDRRSRRQVTVLAFPTDIYLSSELWTRSRLAVYLGVPPSSISSIIPVLDVRNPRQNSQDGISRLYVKWVDAQGFSNAFRLPRSLVRVGPDRSYSERQKRRDAAPVVAQLRALGREAATGFRGNDIVVFFDHSGQRWSSLIPWPFTAPDLAPYLHSPSNGAPTGFDPANPVWRARLYTGSGPRSPPLDHSAHRPGASGATGTPGHPHQPSPREPRALPDPRLHVSPSSQPAESLPGAAPRPTAPPQPTGRHRQRSPTGTQARPQAPPSPNY